MKRNFNLVKFPNKRKLKFFFFENFKKDFWNIYDKLEFVYNNRKLRRETIKLKETIKNLSKQKVGKNNNNYFWKPMRNKI